QPVPERQLPRGVCPRQRTWRGVRREFDGGGRHHRRPRNLPLPRHPPWRCCRRPAQEPGTVTHTPTHEHDGPARDGATPNPYQERQAQGRPDLDAGAPHLQASEMQRLNRKALLFLAGIVLLLLCVAFWIFSGAMSQADERGPRTRSEQAVIPAAPRDRPDLPPEQPVPPPLPELPPLPVYETAAPPPPSSMSMPTPDWSERRGLSLQERRMMDVAGTASVDRGGGVPGMLPPDEYARLMMAAGNPA